MFCVCFGILASVLVPENSASLAFFIVIGVFLAAVGGYFLDLRRGANPLAEGLSPAGESVAAVKVTRCDDFETRKLRNIDYFLFVGPLDCWFCL